MKIERKEESMKKLAAVVMCFAFIGCMGQVEEGASVEAEREATKNSRWSQPAADASVAVDSAVIVEPDSAVVVPPSSTVLFVTSALHRPGASFFGLAGADAICAQTAAAAGLPGTFKAILSDTTANAVDRLSFDYPVTTTNGDLIEATNLWSGAGIANRVRTELGALSVSWVWTGTRTDGTAGVTDCRDWTYPFSMSRGTHANSGTTDSLWLGHDGVGGLCDNRFALYCINSR
jgi:hypothetical protein